MEEFIVEELKLGDVIKISGTTNGIFLITYIDDDKMAIENETEKNVLPINDQKIDGIKSIVLEKRNPEEGYARQNGLLEGVWINIIFNIDGQLEDMNGEIISLEEDCIELRVYPTNEIVYIDFGYNGIPENLNITEINVQNKEVKVEQDDELVELLEDGDRIGDAISYANDENGRKKMKEITEYVNVGKSKKRFGLEEQTNDLLEDLLSSVPEYERTPVVLNAINTIIERYLQLRNEFSVFDEDKVTYIKHGANYRPLVQSLAEFKQPLFWLLPVTEIIKKNDFEIDENDNVIDESIDNIKKLNEIITNYRTIHIDNRYTDFMRKLQTWLAPFLQIAEHKNIIHIGSVKDNFNVIVNNGNFGTTVVKCNKIVTKKSSDGGVIMQEQVQIPCQLDSKKMFSIRYNNETAHLNPQFFENNNNPQFVNLFNADVLYFKSLITLPEPFVRFSCVKLPGTNIMEKSNMGRFFINYNELFKMKIQTVNVTPYLKKSLINENNAIKGSIYKEKGEERFLANIKNYIVNTNEVKRDELFEDYLSEIVPQTKQLFQLMKKYINGKLSIVEIIKTLEPFLIYSSDITFQQYKEMAGFLHEETSKYIKTYNERIEIFRRLKNHDEPYCPNILVDIVNDKDLAYDIYNYDSYPNMTSSEFLSIAIFTDYGDVYNNKLRLDSLNLSETNLNEKIKQTTEFSENTCKAIHLAKRYISLDDLEKDNDRPIFYDEEFDKTPYYLVSNYEKERNLMQEEDFYMFLETVLKNKYSMDETEIKSIIVAFRNGKRQVDESKNAYAMIFNKLEGKIDYYARDQKKWKKDESIKDQPITDDLACVLQENCIVSKSECLSDNVAKEEFMKVALSKIVTEFDKNVALTKGENVEHVKDLFYNSVNRIKFLKFIQRNSMLKYNYRQYDLGRDISDEMVTLSPYIKLRDSILGEVDITKKYNYILEFVRNYTFVMSKRLALSPIYYDYSEDLTPEMSPPTPEGMPPTPEGMPPTPEGMPPTPEMSPPPPSPQGVAWGPHSPEMSPPIGGSSPKNSQLSQESEVYTFNNVPSMEITEEEFAKYTREKDDNSHWLFCNKTKTKLLPKFFYILAKTYIDSPDQFISRLDKLCVTIGKISDDGDKYVDKYSGYTIRHIDFMKEFGDAEDIELDVYEIPNEVEVKLDKKIVNIITGLENTMQIFLDEDDLIITIVHFFIDFMGTKLKEDYEKNQKKKVKGTYEDYLNEIRLYLTLSSFVFALQVHIPGVKFRSVPGCGKFKGNPLTEESKLIDYIACIAAKMSNAVEPWNALTKMSAQNIAKKIRVYTERFPRMPPSDVKNMMEERLHKKKGVPEGEIDETIFYTKWVHFLPAIVPIRIATVLPMEKMDISNYIKKGDIRQIGILLAMKSKIIFYSYMFQQKMQEVVENIVEKQNLLFFNKENVPFLDNACCNDTTDESTLSYFTKINPEIEFINEQVKRVQYDLKYTFRLSKSTLFSDINTKNTIISSSNKYSEYTIIRYLMIVNKFANITDGENEYKEKLAKNQGFRFTEKEFLGAIKENIIIDIPVVDQAPLSMKDLLPQGPISSNLENPTKLNNILALMNESKINDIKKFITRHKKSKDTSILDDLMEWKGAHVNNINLIKKYVYLFSRVFPNIIINGVVQDNLIHSYWNLSKQHSTKISSFCVKYYEPLQTFRNKINPLLEKVMEETKDMYKLSTDAPFMEDYTTLLLNVNYLIDVLHVYVKLADDKPETEDYLIIGQMQTIKRTTASLIVEYLNYIKRARAMLDNSYEDIMKHSFAFKQSEKQLFRERIEKLPEEEQKVDIEMRKCGLGIWGKGLKKSVFQYDKDELQDEPGIAEEVDKDMAEDMEIVDEDMEDMENMAEDMEIVDEDMEDMDEDMEDMEDNIDGNFSD